ncbi:FAD-dependent oxidoreductase [Microbacterium murale]|uniref:2-polyprenyl-6-methoxyphenol hydroxylase-like FAD-dependent oxidoreductase n=1 Tax=Microbacterium murale TaxID=1081040 RepID=A0ABU0P5J3_9MICO|nr:NAD(P)/FAD-dependent oxidoreductase [Microbacterium murale]MDQ0641981.1 2-polyprenyl-6-methoxyphenol hydroxylase-like FAD-dependent oxidoreductase [Microbacterium murale]
MPDHDVAIVGGGPVGLVLACLLAQVGVDIALFEQRETGDDRSRAIGIHPPGRAALDAVGVGEDARRQALELHGGDVLCDGRVLASVSFTTRQEVLILPQHRTHALLVERLAHLQPDAVRLGHAVRDVRDEGDVVRLVIEAGGVGHETTASIVVGADGVRSGIRRRLGIPWRERRGSGSYTMADVADEGASTRVRLYCESGGIVESFPLPEGRRRWVVSDPLNRLRDGAAFAQEIEERTGVRLDRATEIAPTPFRAQQHRAARAAVGRAVLLGDALHETSPIGGQGMNLGWNGARQLAVAIERSLRSAAPDFSAYERGALRSAARAQRRSSFYMTMGHPLHGFGLSARNTLIRALGSAPLRRSTADLITMRGL